ncbi:GguC protein (plasmid) [Paroceanicella profunda]|uniref:GguC protein n=1 Tax=Paroceanicella profunda TaxID=2579971 RepID=A0A5B8G3T4_9RHOB|nr:AraD1 family protein [Paroceanicella profunda]QDL94049.1 GguC protein [Paroceanicella profunda]
MLISQIKDPSGTLRVVVRNGTEAYIVRDAASVYEIARHCISTGSKMIEQINALGFGEAVDLERAYEEGRVMLPITHPDATHMHITGTGLTHLGSASTRSAMHEKDKAATEEEVLTDSMKMFRMGLEAGRPKPGEVGVQPEWFYKGNGHAAVAPGAPLVSPAFAEDGGEEPEIAGIYVNGPDGTPYRLGFALANEFSDHVTERQNYLFLAHSKLRPCSFGPEMLLGEPPADISGTSRILRDGKAYWEKPFLSGEKNMSHTIANLEHHHFKYGIFRAPGDVHVHMFGTATLSFADKISVAPGDVFEMEAGAFGLPLRNPLAVAAPVPASGGAYAVATL